MAQREQPYIAADAAEPEPSWIERVTQAVEGPLRIRSLAVTLLLILALLYTAYLARDILVPIMAALVLQFVVAPAMRGLNRLRIPESVGAVIVVVAVLGLLGVGGWTLSGPVSQWAERLPMVARQVENKLSIFRGPVEQVQEASRQVERATEPAPGAEKPVEVVVRKPTLLEQALTQGQLILTDFGIIVILLYFLLASGDLFKLKLVKVIHRLQDKKRAVAIVRQIEHDVSAYLSTVTLINIGLGFAVGGALFALGVPNAALWGAMAALLNYVPYVGSLVGVGIVAVVGFISFDEPLYALAPAAAYAALTALEGNFITPAILGRKLTLNPVVIVVNLILWGWLWGVPGALLAGPFLIVIKVFCDNIPPLAAIGEFLSSEPDKHEPA